MENKEPQTKTRRANSLGPTGVRVASNVVRVRKERKLTTAKLVALLKDLGRPVPTTGVTKIELGDRRVDVDDLVAIALALNVSPLTLLLPPSIGDEQVDLLDGYAVSASTAWAWGMGRRTAMDPDPGGVIDVGDDLEPGGVVGAGDGTPSLYAELEYEREQEFRRRQKAFRDLAYPEELRRAGDDPTLRLAQTIAALVEDIVTPDLGTPPEVVESWSRMARRRIQHLLGELDEIDERIVNRTYPGIAYPLEASMKSKSSVSANGRVIPANKQSGGDSD